MRTYYGKRSPRGFANEIEVHVFRSRADRDAWVAADRAELSACMRRPCTASEARRLWAYKGDALTESFHSRVEHGQGMEAPWIQ